MEAIFVLIVRRKFTSVFALIGQRITCGSRPIFIEKQTAGRRGKPVNVIKNVPLQKADLKKLAKELKKNL